MAIDILSNSLGVHGVRLLAAGETSAVGERFVAVMAVGGNATFDTTATVGDSLTAFILTQDLIIPLPCNQIVVDGGSAGSVLAWLAR